MWIGSGLTVTTLVASTNTLLQSLSAAALLLRPFTIIRTRLLIQFESDQTAGSENPQGVFAKIVVSDQAIAAGAASIPNPITNADAPFHVYNPLISSFLLVTAAGFTEPTGYTVEVDSKAMRKVGANEDVATMFSMRNAVGGVIQIEGRTLVKLH